MQVYVKSQGLVGKKNKRPGEQLDVMAHRLLNLYIMPKEVG